MLINMNQTVTVNHTQNMDIQKVFNVLLINCQQRVGKRCRILLIGQQINSFDLDYVIDFEND